MNNNSTYQDNKDYDNYQTSPITKYNVGNEGTNDRLIELLQETINNIYKDDNINITKAIDDIKLLDDDLKDTLSHDNCLEQKNDDSNNEINEESDEESDETKGKEKIDDQSDNESDYCEPYYKKIKISHNNEVIEDKVSEDNKHNENFLIKEYEHTYIKDKQFENYIDNLYYFLYNYGYINKTNKNKINPNYIINENKFLNKLTIDGTDFEFNIDNYKTCYMVNKVKRRVLYDFSFMFYFGLFNLNFLILALESIFTGMILRSCFLLLSILVFMSLHIFINLFRSSKYGSLFNKLYELHAYYTDYDYNYIKTEFTPSNYDTKLYLDLTGEHRITCDKSFFIDGNIISKDNQNKKVTLLLNKPNKFDGVHSLILEDPFYIHSLLINKHKINNLDVIYSTNNDNIVDKLLINNSIITDKGEGGYNSFVFDLNNNDSTYIPMFFRLLSTK